MKAKDSLAQCALMTVKEAFARCQLTPDQLPSYDRYKANQRVLWCSDDLVVDGDLSLDWNTDWGKAEGLIVAGNLTVNGTIINAHGDRGLCLVVRGQLSADNALLGGASIYIAAGATVGGLLLAHYNDGSLRIDGVTEAGLVISDDHDTELTTTSAYWNSHHDVIGMPLSDYLHADIELVDPKERDVEEPYWSLYEAVEPERLIQRILAGQPVLREANDPRPFRKVAAWRDVIKHYPSALQHVPEKLRSTTLCELALRHNGRVLQVIPSDRRTAKLCALAMKNDPDAFPFVPEALRSESLCWQAVKHDGRHLEEVPESLRTAALCACAIATDEYHYALAATPPALLTESMCIGAVENDPANLHAVPIPLRTVDVCVAALKQRPVMVLTDVPIALRKDVCRIANYIIKGDPTSDRAIATEAAHEQAMHALLKKLTD